MVIKITRIEYSPEGTMGVLQIDDKIFGVTLEPLWKNNAPNISCVPTGMYQVTEVFSPSFGHTFQIVVPGRTHILFHQGNTLEDTHGCVLLGTGFGKIDGIRGIKNSRKAFSTFLEELRDVQEKQDIVLSVVNAHNISSLT